MGKVVILWSGLLLLFSACMRPVAKVQMDREISTQAAPVGIPFRPETVVIKICVDKDGAVVSAAHDPEKSTTSDTVLINKSIKAANQYRFSPSSQNLECGSITFNFKLKNDSPTTKH